MSIAYIVVGAFLLLVAGLIAYVVGSAKREAVQAKELEQARGEADASRKVAEKQILERPASARDVVDRVRRRSF